MPGEEKSSSLAQINITQILNQIAMLSAELAVLQARVEDLEQYEGERWQFNPGGEGGGGQPPVAFEWLSANRQNQTVTIREGFVEGRYGYRAVPGATVSVGGTKASPHFIIAQGTDTTAAIVPNSISAASYTSDAQGWARILYRVYLDTNGTPVMDMIGDGVGGIVL